MTFRKIAIQAGIYLLVTSMLLAAVYAGNAAVSVVSQQIPLKRSHTIVIDAGHGGEDGGANSCSGIPESSYNLEIALRLQELLHLFGYQVKMIRTTDKSVYTQGTTLAEKKRSDLQQRVQLVNKTENGLLVSIHQNTFPDGKYRGAQIFYGPQKGSRELASQMQKSFCQSLNPGSNRKSKPADGIYLMQHIACTGVLIECGFLSNTSEEAQLRSPEYQKKICAVIAAALTRFLTEESRIAIMEKNI